MQYRPISGFQLYYVVDVPIPYTIARQIEIIVKIIQTKDSM
ncbi:MAG: hypothetical protein REV35_00355 [Burkholderia sp.]|nr:hypothetical protein [Burkholderia sp.]